MATTLMMSHHAFRRDAALLVRALGRLAGGDRAQGSALSEEWTRFRAALHGHHQHEDNGLFPALRSQHAELAELIALLGEQHELIDPLLACGDRAFAELRVADAVPLLSELAGVLHPHLATEEEHLIPLMRDTKEFPPITSDADADMFAEGFAWCSHGVHPHVVERVHAMLPPALTSRMPAATAAFEQRYRRVWGNAGSGASRTSIPDWLPGGA